MSSKRRKQTLYQLAVDVALEELNAAIRWEGPEHGVNSQARAFKRVVTAEALVSLLEVFNCGSIGGYDKNQPGNQSLRKRIVWLMKHKNYGDKEFRRKLKRITTNQ